MSLRSRASAAVLTAATTCMLAPGTVLAAAATDAKKPVPPQVSYGEETPLDLPQDTQDKATEAVGATGGGLVRTFVGLAIVIAVIWGLYWVLKQVKASREERVSGAGLSSAAVVPLGPNRSLHLVRAGRELVLLGVAEHGVTPIRRYTEEEAEELGLISPEDDAPVATGNGVAVKTGPVTIGQAVNRLRELTVRK